MSVQELKAALLDSFWGVDRGLSASSDARAEINELISQLEANNPTPLPNKVRWGGRGAWRGGVDQRSAQQRQCDGDTGASGATAPAASVVPRWASRAGPGAAGRHVASGVHGQQRGAAAAGAVAAAAGHRGGHHPGGGRRQHDGAEQGAPRRAALRCAARPLCCGACCAACCAPFCGACCGLCAVPLRSAIRCRLWRLRPAGLYVAPAPVFASTVVNSLCLPLAQHSLSTRHSLRGWGAAAAGGAVAAAGAHVVCDQRLGGGAQPQAAAGAVPAGAAGHARAAAGEEAAPTA